jgi:hypothetical protein
MNAAVGKRNCKNCRYWSEMIAGNMHNNGGEIGALCLRATSPHKGQYMSARGTCSE